MEKGFNIWLHYKEEKAKIFFSWNLCMIWFFSTTFILIQTVLPSLRADAVIFNKSFKAMKHLAKVKSAVSSVERRLNSFSSNTWRHIEMESTNKLFTALLIVV